MLPLLPFWGLRFFMQKNSEEQIQSVKKLRSKYIHISNGMIRTGDIAAELFQSDVLTEKERDDIQHLLSTPVRANEQLLNTLMLKDNRAFDCFLAALNSTKQTHIEEFLKCDGKYLDTKHSLMIQRNYMALVDNLDVDCGHLLDRLFKYGLLSGREMEDITAKPTKHEKNETLLALVSKFSVENFNKFLQALEESSQEHVVSILTGKDYTKSESKTVESKLQCKDSKLREELQQNPEVQQNSNQNLLNYRQIKILHSTKGIEAPSFHVIRKSVITFGSKFTQLPDELQTELARKVASLRQKTVRTNVDICYLKLLQGKEVNRKQTEFEDINENLRRINESVEKTALIFKDNFNTDILNEELDWHRNNSRHLAIDLSNERQKSIGFEMKLVQQQKEKEEIKKGRDELRRSLHMSTKCIGEFKKLHEKYQQESEDVQKEKDELERSELVSKSRIDVLVGEIQRYQRYQKATEDLRKEKDELERSELVSKSRIDDLICDIQRYQKATEDLRKEKDELERSELVSKSRIDDLIDEIQRYQKETEKLLTERDGFQNSMVESKQRIGDLVTQIEQYQNETMHFQTQRDELQKQLDEARELMEVNRKRYEAPLQERDIELVEMNGVTFEVITPAETKSYSKNGIRGITLLNQQLFIATERCNKIEVYDSKSKTFMKPLSFESLLEPGTMASCIKDNCIYLIDKKYQRSKEEIFKFRPDGTLITKWSKDVAHGRLSVIEKTGQVVLAAHGTEPMLKIFSAEGKLLLKTKKFTKKSKIMHLWHAVKLSQGGFVVTHGRFIKDKSMHRVCKIDEDGKILKSFGGERGSGNDRLNDPSCVIETANESILVADMYNHRVLLLSKDLEFKKVLFAEEYRIKFPEALYFDEENNRLYVACNLEIARHGRVICLPCTIK